MEGVGGVDSSVCKESTKTTASFGRPGEDDFVEIIGSDTTLEAVDRVIVIEPENKIDNAVSDHLAFAVELILGNEGFLELHRILSLTFQELEAFHAVTPWANDREPSSGVHFLLRERDIRSGLFSAKGTKVFHDDLL